MKLVQAFRMLANAIEMGHNIIFEAELALEAS